MLASLRDMVGGRGRREGGEGRGKGGGGRREGGEGRGKGEGGGGRGEKGKGRGEEGGGEGGGREKVTHIHSANT